MNAPRATLACLALLALLAASVAGTAFADGQGFPLAVEGLDPTLLVEGQEARGSESHSAEFGGFTYYFRSAETQARFEADPERYAFQTGDKCTVMPQARAKGDLFAVHEGKLYGFGSYDCKKEFLEEPSRFTGDDAAS